MKCITLSSGKQVCFDSTTKAQDGRKLGNEERINYLMDKGKDYDNLDFAIHQPLRFIGHSIAPNAVHGTDTYKLPNHMTFSNESKYSNDQHKGGTWGTTPDGRYTFTPTEWNIKNAGGKENLERWWNDGPNSEGAHGNILKFQPGGKTLVVPNSSVKLPPLSKEQQLAQNTRTQGDMPIAKSIIKQQERMREEEAVKKKLAKQSTIKLSEAQKKDIAAQGLKEDVLADQIRRNQYTLNNPDDESPVVNVLGDAEQDIKNNDFGILNAMFNVPTGLISGRYESPSQAIGRFAMRNDLNQLQNAMIDDQGNPTGLGMATDMFGPGLFLKGLNAVPKMNPWKINPFAEKLKDVNKSYRVAGLDALEDFQNTGVLRSRRILPENATFADKVKARPTGFPSFQKGFADMRYANPEGSVIFETSLPTFKRGQINPVTGKPIKGSHYAHRVINPETGQVMTEIPAKDIRIFGDKPHWLKGYQEINGPSKGMLTSFEYNFNPKNLKTESGLEWIKQWHSHPDFTKRYSANKNIFTGDADNFKNLILQNLDDYQDKNYLDLLKDKGFKDFIESKLSTGGVSYGTPDNIYINKTAFFPFNKIGKESTRAHELSHLTDINGLTLTISDMEDLLKPFGYNPTQYYQKFPTPKHRKKGEGYYLNPTEIRARMNEGRFKFGLMPSDNFTPEMFDEVSKSHNWYGMNNYIKDKKGFIDLMNKFWAVPAGAVGVGAAAKSIGAKEPMQRKGGLIKAQEGSKNTKNYQPSKDVIISGNEYSDYDKRASDLEAKYRQCHEGDLDCLGSANQFYNQYTARQAGLPTTWEMYQNRGVNSVNAWDVAALPNTTILYNFNKQGPFQNLSEEERMRIYKNIPLGATVSYMGGDTGSHRSGVESGHKKAGLPDTTHAAKVIGFSEDGFPIIFDYGKTFTLRPDILGGNLGGYTPQIVSFPNEVKDAIFENVNKPGVGRALSLDPKSVIVDPKLGGFKKTGTGKLFSPESLRLPIGSDAYEASKGFAKTINEFRDTAVTKLGIDPEYYDSYLAPAAFGIAGQESEFGTKGEPVAEFADRWIPGLHNRSIGPLQINKALIDHPELKELFKEYADINHKDDLYDSDKALKAAIILMNYNKGPMKRAFNQNKKQPEYGLSEPELLKLAYYYNNPSSVPVALGESNYVRNVNDMSTYLLPSEGYTIKTKEISYPKYILKAPWAPRPPYKKEKGGKNINNTGYLDNSDTKHNPYNVIPSNNITMDGVSIPLLLMPDGDKARVVMPHSGEYNFPNSQYVTEIPLAQQGAKVYPPGYHKTPPPNFNIPVSQRDSVANMAYNTMTWEENAGSPLGTGLPDFGYHSSQEPVSKRPTNFTPPRNKQEAVDLFMKEVAPKVDYFPTAMEQSIAGDFMYNTGRDARVYMLDQYLKSIGKTGLPNRGSYNIDTKSDAWTPELKANLDKEWNTYKTDINKLPTQKRRVLMNNGRDFYYKNTYTDDQEGVTYWSRSKQKQNPDDAYDSKTGFYYQRGKDGSLSPQYGKTWYGRQHATDQYEYVNPNAVNDPTSKFYPKRQPGGQNVKKGPGPFLIPEPRAQFKSIPVDNLADPRLRAYQDSVIQNNKSIEALQNFNKAYNTKQPYVATPENLTDDYKNSGVKQQAKYTNPKNTKNYLQPSKKIDDLNEEQRANLLEAFNTQQEGTPINLPTALYYADLFNNSTYKNEDIWFDYHTNPIQPYHLAPMEQIATKNVSPIPVNDERVLPSMNFPIPTFAGTMYTPTTEGLTIPVPTVNIVKETVPPRVNAKRRQNKVNVGSNTKTKVKFDIDQREILSREDLDSLRGSVGLDPKGYESGGKIIKLSTGKIIKIK